MIQNQNKDEYVRALTKSLTEIQHLANERLDDNAVAARIKSIDHEMLTDLQVGEYVLMVHRPSDVRNVKVTLPWRGPLKVVGSERKDFYKLLDLTQDIEVMAHRVEITPLKCTISEIEARKAVARDGESELFIEQVLSHIGKADKTGSLEFKCKVEGFEEPIYFLYRNCKYVKAIQDYCLGIAELKSLKKTWLIDNTRKKKSNKYLLNDYIVEETL